MFSDADAAALYDLLNPWDPLRWPSDAFYDELVATAGSVLDVGCGTGSMLRRARESGHTGRLVGLDPDRAALARARRRTDVEWVEGTAADAEWNAEFDLATMVSHAFQCLVTDHDARASLTAIHAALRPGARFAFETRHPRARAWESWTPSNASVITDAHGRALRVWHEIDSVAGDVVTFTGTTAAPDGAVLRVDRTSLRFYDVATLDALLAETGFEVEARYGDWDRGPLTGTSAEIITIARRTPPHRIRPSDRGASSGPRPDGVDLEELPRPRARPRREEGHPGRRPGRGRRR
ncbi:class I SAM-dependent methyltransferase [Streptomyces sp. NBC_01497]|uniref:class I SAM-dependent methyltransferase n=1 Tax=Streptomyces sp. NBC_01497 TaxID=2903885 RepID=UPI002E2F6441|nr:class I SAM-dependent methyltransferase [Streptomyces sp. NBC_01497]